jgi:hypothetical protein
LAYIDRFRFESEGGIARDDKKGGDFREVGDDVLGYPVAEIFLLGVAAHIGEGQHTDRNRRTRSGRACLDGCSLRLRPRLPAANREDANGPFVALDDVLTEIGEARGDLTRDMVADGLRECDTAGRRQGLEASGHIDALTIEVVPVDDDVSEIDSDAVPDPLPLARFSSVRAIASWMASAQATAATTLPNSTNEPSPISLTTLPPCFSICGRTRARRFA